MNVAKLSFLMLLVALAAGAQDAVEVDPDHHKVEFENDHIRVVRMVYPPGYKTPMHSHYPGVTVSLSETKVHSWQSSGEEADGETEFGTVSWSDGTAVHSNQVVGDTPLELVRVEIKKKGTTPVPTPSHDSVKVDPDHHRVEIENDQVRVVRASYPPGYEAPLHNHLPGLGVTLQSGSQFEVTFEDGTKNRGDGPEVGQVGDFGEVIQLHRTKNVGGSASESLRIELKTKL